MAEKRGQYGLLDWTRLVMAVLVAAIHTQPISGEGYLFRLYAQALRLAVPFFFLAGGYLAERKRIGQGTAPRAFWTERMKKTLKIYLLWSLVYLPAAVIGYFDEQWALLPAAANYGLRLALTGDHFYSWQLWYLLAAAYGMGLAALVREKGGMKGLLICAGLLYLLGHGVNLLYAGKALTPAALLAMPQAVDGPGRILTGALYLALGMALAHGKRPGRAVCALAFAVFFLLSGVWDMWPLSLLSAVSLFLLLCAFSYPSTRRSGRARQLSAGIYYAHMAGYFIWYLLRGHRTETGCAPFLFALGVSAVYCCAAAWARRVRRGGDAP